MMCTGKVACDLDTIVHTELRLNVGQAFFLFATCDSKMLLALYFWIFFLLLFFFFFFWLFFSLTSSVCWGAFVGSGRRGSSRVGREHAGSKRSPGSFNLF